MELADSDLQPLDSSHFVIRKWLIFWGLLSFIGLLLTTSFYASRYGSENAVSFVTALIIQLTRTQIWAALSILIIVINSKFRAKGRHWIKVILMHFPVSIIWAFVCALFYSLIIWLADGAINSQSVPFSGVLAAQAVPTVVVGILAYKIILTTDIALNYNRKFHIAEQKALKLENQLAQAQLQTLRMQLQPHFLFNTLNSVSDLALENPKRSVKMIARLGDFLRFTIDSGDDPETSLEKEIEFLTHYLEIEQTRFRDRLKVDFEIQPEVLSSKVPSLILQPLVENAIKHGISGKIGVGHIAIRAAKRNGDLLLEVENDGNKISGGERDVLTNGVGIRNTVKRLKQLYGDQCSFEFIPLKTGGAKVQLGIPLS